jgi:hypothetical protein
VAKKQVADAAKAKQAKQKKIVILLAVVLVLAIAYAANTLMGMQGGGGAKPLAAPVGQTATTPAAAPTSTATAAPTLAGTSPTVVVAKTDSSSLVAVVTPPADPGQLESFSRFSSKDPFASAGPSTSSTSGSTTTTTTTPAPTPTPSPTPPAPPSPPPTNVVISINGTEESVTPGSDFPAANPIFQLVSLSAKSAKVSIAGGSYANGQPTVTLSVNTPLTLMNTADGTRYTLLLLPQGTAAPAAASSTGTSSSSSTSTTPTTTTTSPTGP